MESSEIALVERRLPEDVRGTRGEIAARRAIILKRNRQFSSEGERQWVLAEELGHILLEDQLVESTAPGAHRIRLQEWQRDFYEREARAFAAELLMPLARVRERWFEESAQVGEAQLMQRECLLQA